MSEINSFLSYVEIKSIGFNKFGENLLISRYARFYNPHEISLCNNIRIDDFCILSGKINLKNNIHISAYCGLYGGAGINIDDFSGLSPRTTIFSVSDNFNGDYLIGPMVDLKYRNLVEGTVNIGKYIQIGAGTVILPNVNLGEGVVVGAMSLVDKSLSDWCIYAGIPVRFVKIRNKGLLNYIK